MTIGCGVLFPKTYDNIAAHVFLQVDRQPYTYLEASQTNPCFPRSGAPCGILHSFLFVWGGILVIKHCA